MTALDESPVVKSEYVFMRDGRYVYRPGEPDEFVYPGSPINNKTSCKRHNISLTCSLWRNLDILVRKFHASGEISGWVHDTKYWEVSGSRKEERGTHSYWHSTQRNVTTLYKPSTLFAALAADWPYWHRAEMQLDAKQVDPEELELELVTAPRVPAMAGINGDPRLSPVVSASCDITTFDLTKGQLRCLVGVTKEAALKQGLARLANFNKTAMAALIRKKYVVAQVVLDAYGRPTFGVKPTQDAGIHALLTGED